jgi:type IV secretion system protein VirB10
MSETTDKSPDYLADTNKLGEGVRRLNRKPLLIVLGLLSIFLAAVGYTAMQRQAMQQAKGSGTPEDELPKVPKAATPQVTLETAKKPEYPGNSSTSGQPLGQPIVPALTDSPPQGGVLGANTTLGARQPDPEGDARRQREARVEQSKQTAYETALNAGSSIQDFQSKNAQQPTAGAAGAMPAAFPTPQAPAIALPNQADADPNMQERKRAFLSGTPELATYLAHTRTPPISTMEIKAGTVIPGVMISGLNSDLPGQLIAQVRENVYDTATGDYLLIPAGARLIGMYDSSVAFGQERALVIWSRIIYPDGSSLSLDNMPGADRSGYAGFNDQVNNHYLKIFGSAVMLSVFSAGVQLSQPQQSASGTLTNQQIMTAALGQQLGQVGMEMIRKNMQIQPTLGIRPGYRFVLMVTKDIVLPPWK